MVNTAMAGQLVGYTSQLGMAAHETCGASYNILLVPDEYRSKWYFSRKEIEHDSPSRKDGIDLRKENQLRTLYCSFLQDLGMKLAVPQVTIATSIMFCHRFYLHQSHAKNGWQTIATVCMFLASKVEETPCALSKVVPIAYEMIYRKGPVAVQRIHLKESYEEQKELILIGERLLLSTIAFDFNIQHPYKPLVAAIKKLGILQNDVLKVAWNFVNDWLRTTLCLQYKPHYVAAGSLYLAAKLNKVKLPTERGLVWWHEFDVTPQQLEEVIQQMMELLGNKRRSIVPCTDKRPCPTPLAVQKEASSSPESCVLSRPGSSSSSSHELCGEAGGDVATRYADYDLSSGRIKADEKPSTSEHAEAQPHAGDSESPNGVVEDSQKSSVGKDEVRIEHDQGPWSSACVAAPEGLPGIDKDRIRAALKKRKLESRKVTKMDDSSEDAWIERELEAGVELG